MLLIESENIYNKKKKHKHKTNNHNNPSAN